jgi:hypothetical protein
MVGKFFRRASGLLFLRGQAIAAAFYEPKGLTFVCAVFVERGGKQNAVVQR